MDSSYLKHLLFTIVLMLYVFRTPAMYAMIDATESGNGTEEKIVSNIDNVNNDKSNAEGIVEEKGRKWTPIQIALYNPIQVPGAQNDVYGFRLNILYGLNRDIYGFDVGMVNKAESVYGIQTALIRNIINENMGGIQTSLLTNDVKGNVALLQIALFRNIVKGNMAGLQACIDTNDVDGKVNGLQIAFRSNTVNAGVNGIQFGGGGNIVKGSVRGMQNAVSVNGVNGTMIGMQTAFGANGVQGNMYGIQTSLMGNIVLVEKKKLQFIDIINLIFNPASAIYTLMGDKSADKGHMVGMQTSMFNGVVGTMTGIQTALFFNVVGNMTGIQSAVAINNVAGNMAGIQLALANNNVSARMTGIQLSLLGNESNGMSGFQAACVNIDAQPFDKQDSVSKGIQLGLINYSACIKGVQIGLVNWSRKMVGVQIGLLNIIETNPVPFMPIINFSTRL